MQYLHRQCLPKEGVDDEQKTEIGKRMKATFVQEKILCQNPDLAEKAKTYIGKHEIKEETEGWKLNKKLKKIHIGGEAAVFKEKFGDLEIAVRVHAFDPLLFTKKLDAGKLKQVIHLFSDYKEKNAVPFHENIVRHYANVELYDGEDTEKEDCLGWVTIMEKCDNDDLHTALKENNLVLKDRKQIALGSLAAFEYLESIGITYCDKKPQNFLLVRQDKCIITKLCDYGLVMEESGIQSFREMGYVRKGSKFKNKLALFSGTPGFYGDKDNYFYFYFCDWITCWSLLYRPINDSDSKNSERREIDKIIGDCNAQKIKYLQNKNTRTNIQKELINEIQTIITLPEKYVLGKEDAPNVMHSCQLSSIKIWIEKIQGVDMNNLTTNVPDQKSSNLCVPLSLTELIRYAIKNDLKIVDTYNEYTTAAILTTLTMMVYPRSMAGLNRNPTIREKDFQLNDVFTLLTRIRDKTYLNESGWEMVQSQGAILSLPRSSCEFKDVLLHEQFDYHRPLTVTVFYKYPDDSYFFHQMTLDRVKDGEYYLQNTLLKSKEMEKSKLDPLIKIERTRPYVRQDWRVSGCLKGPNGERTRVIPIKEMTSHEWYLHPTAFELKLIRF